MGGRGEVGRRIPVVDGMSEAAIIHRSGRAPAARAHHITSLPYRTSISRIASVNLIPVERFDSHCSFL